ncbi:2998_t:CDS:1, partial [Entrophospora sp. SA101]
SPNEWVNRLKCFDKLSWLWHGRETNKYCNTKCNCQGNVLSGKCPVREMSCWGNIPSGKWLSGKRL